MLGDIPWSPIALDQFENVGEAEEIESTYVGNAISKAKFYASADGRDRPGWTIQGLEVTALGGAPGVLSARYAGPNRQRDDRSSSRETTQRAEVSHARPIGVQDLFVRL